MASLFQRVATILDQARESVVQSVNSHMVLAYWHIGREIVQTLQSGDERAEYGRRLVADLSERLTGRFGRGFSTTNLWYFRQFYLTYAERRPEILHLPGGELTIAGKLHKACGELPTIGASHRKADRVLRDLSLAVEHPAWIEGFPTIGLILCAQKNDAVARYSVLHESKQIFAAKYLKVLPTEKDLRREIQRQRRLLDMRHSPDAKAGEES